MVHAVVVNPLVRHASPFRWLQSIDRASDWSNTTVGELRMSSPVRTRSGCAASAAIPIYCAGFVSSR